MEALSAWFRDWSDACTYAGECAPDLSSLAPAEPYSALASIAAGALLLWWWNERRLKKILSREARFAREDDVDGGELRRLLEEMRDMDRAPAENRAA